MYLRNINRGKREEDDHHYSSLEHNAESTGDHNSPENRQVAMEGRIGK